MIQTYTRKEKLFQLTSILYPILITQLAMYAMNFFDTTMSGHYAPADLAGVAIGSSLWVPVFTGLSGILMAMTPIVSQLVGAKKNSEVSFSVIQGVYLAVIMALLILGIGSLILNPILEQMNLDSHVGNVAHDYLAALSLGIIPLFVYNVLRCFLDALGKTRVSMFITLTSLPLNVIFNYLLIYGKLGFPQLGGVGAGLASALTYWLICIIALFIIHKKEPFHEYHIFQKVYAASFKKWKEILMIGVPIGFAIFFETSIFSAVTLLMSSYSTVTIASHQAAMNFASFLYMIPLSISMALTIVVGFEVGAKRFKDASQYSWMGVIVAVCLAGISGLVLISFRTNIAGIYTTDSEVLSLTAEFMLYALFFQLSDAIQAPIQGALRGYKDVNLTFLMAFISYWVIGLPVGYILANHTSLEAFGYWIGLITGLAVGALCLLSRLIQLQKKYRPFQKSSLL